MLIVLEKKDLMVESVEEGTCGKGMHVNTVRRPAYVKHKGKYVPNPEAGALIHNDGCWDKGALITVRIIDRDEEVAS